MNTATNDRRSRPRGVVTTTIVAVAIGAGVVLTPALNIPQAEAGPYIPCDQWQQMHPGWPCVDVPEPPTPAPGAPTTPPPLPTPALPGQPSTGAGSRAGALTPPPVGPGNNTPIVPVPGQPPSVRPESVPGSPQQAPNPDAASEPPASSTGEPGSTVPTTPGVPVTPRTPTARFVKDVADSDHYDPWSWDGCAAGYHKSGYGVIDGTCYPDYDYNITNVKYLGTSTKQGEGPVTTCTTTEHGTCTLQYQHSVSVTNTLSQSEELSGEAGLSVDGINAKIGKKLTTTEQNQIQNLNNFSATTTLPGQDLAPNYAADGYMEYSVYQYTLQKYDTQSKTVVATETFLYMVPVGIKGVPRR
ncbi:hypothetical protein ACIBCN_28065 [Nocardia sp. NPDC051052]|uniref:hypothetical protein n=1 Tax=Nocardia sp. NPDC051052 TaxID=3364322 RepID=UPI00379E2EB5